MQNSNRRPLINAFIVTYFTAIVCCSFPYQCTMTQFVNRMCGPLLAYSGLWQYWDMFGPIPSSMDYHLDAVVTFKDGHTETWNSPKMRELGYVDRYQKERYRKWAHENVRLDDHSGLWEPTAIYVARKFVNSANPPVKVALRRHWAEVHVPETTDAPATPLNWGHYTFYEKTIASGDLK